MLASLTFAEREGVVAVMENAERMCLAIAMMLCLALVTSSSAFAQTEEPITEPASKTWVQSFGGVKVVTPNCDESAAAVRREIAPVLTAILSMNGADKAKKGKMVVASRSPITVCRIAKTKAPENKK
jgi:hypothetical protein